MCPFCASKNSQNLQKWWAAIQTTESNLLLRAGIQTKTSLTDVAKHVAENETTKL